MLSGGRFPVLLEGPTSVGPLGQFWFPVGAPSCSAAKAGKTSLVKFLAHLTGHESEAWTGGLRRRSPPWFCRKCGNFDGNISEVDAQNNIFVKTPGYNNSGSTVGGGNPNAPAMFSEVDAGTITGARLVRSPLVDNEFRLRAATEILLDDETFNYSAQNTGKHVYNNTTMTITWNPSGMTTNGSAITTTTTGVQFYTRAMFQLFNGNNGLIVSTVGSLSGAVTTNTTIDFGMMIYGTGNPYAPFDGAYFRFNSSGLQGVINSAGSETSTSVFSFTPNANQKYRFTMHIYARVVYFFIDNILYGSLISPVASGQPFQSAALNYGIRHAIVGGAAGTALQFTVTDYNIYAEGATFARSLGETNNATFGSYQGLSGGTMGGLSVYTNNTNPTAAVPSNTALTANLPSGLGGNAWETFSSGLALNTDGILMSYQLPTGSSTVPGKRLKVTGVKLSGFIQTAMTGGPCASVFRLAYGHSAVSLATAEAATTKKPRILILPELTQTISGSQAVSTPVSQPGGCVSTFTEPIYVNPGEKH